MSKSAYMGKVTVYTVTFHICWLKYGRNVTCIGPYIKPAVRIRSKIYSCDRFILMMMVMMMMGVVVMRSRRGEK